MIVHEAQSVLVLPPEVLKLQGIRESPPGPVHGALGHLVHSQVEDTLGPGLGHLLPTVDVHLGVGVILFLQTVYCLQLLEKIKFPCLTIKIPMLDWTIMK